MSNLLQHQEKLYRYIKHRERVLNAKPVIQTKPRSRSVPERPKMSLQKRDEERRIQEANERLLQSLLKICDRKPKF